MADIRIVQKGPEFAEAVTLDWLLLPAGDLDTSQELVTAAIVALGTDRRALTDDQLPNPDSDDRRGWWADTDAEMIWDGWPIGSRLWLLAREKITGSPARQGSFLVRIEDYMREALQPFVDVGIASRHDVTVQRTGLGMIEARAILYRGEKPDVDLRYQDLWSSIAA